MMMKYRKLGVAAIGLVLMIMSDLFGIEMPFMADGAWDMLVSVGTAVGVWGVPNAT